MTLTCDEVTWKVCSKCGVEKALVNFHRQAKSPDGRSSSCRKCVSGYHKERSGSMTEYRRKARLRKYGLTVEQFEEMLAAQDGRCAICGTDEPGGRFGQWHIDHDHNCCPNAESCGKCLRDILCHMCNRGLGLFKDDPDRLTSALAYVMRWESCEFTTGGC